MEVISQLYEPHSPLPPQPAHRPCERGKSIAGINHCSTRRYQQIQNTPSSISPRIFLRRTDLWIIKTCETQPAFKSENLVRRDLSAWSSRTDRLMGEGVGERQGEGVRLARRWHGLMVGGWLQRDYLVLQGRPWGDSNYSLHSNVNDVHW